MSDEDEIEIKAILLGNSGVGKTNLINTCVGLKFDQNFESTSSGSYMQKDIVIKDKKFSINLWDAAGQELFKSVTKIFIKGSEIVIFVYDITNLQSFKDLDEWIHICNQLIDTKYVGGIIGNKRDLYLEEQVLEEEARKFAEEKKMPFALVSAKDEPKGLEFFLKELIEEYYGLEDKSIKNESMKLDLKKEKVAEKKKKYCFGLFG